MHHFAERTDADLKRIVAAALVMLLLLLMVTASASTAGTLTDPLVTLSHLDGVFAAALKSDISKQLGSSTDKSVSKLDELYGKYADYSFASRFTRISLSAGDTVMLQLGSSYIPISGSATLSSVSGTLINISTGAEVAAGTRLTQSNRYFCAEDTIAIIKADNSAVGQVDGYYFIETALPNRQHPVFKDVRERDWYYAAVDFVYQKGLFQGATETTFSPASSMTRGMFVTVLYRLEGQPNTAGGGQFTDVQDTKLYYYNAVSWANTNRVVLGYNDGTFRPNDSVTREQMAVIIYRYAEYKRRDMSASGAIYDTFSDRGDVSAYATDAMRWVVSKGVINGSNGKLLPKNTATRAEVAQIISNYVNIIR